MNEVIFNFKSKNFVVTGASSGMGKQIAIELALAGANVLAIARREEKLIELQNEYKNIEYIACDVANKEKIEDGIINFVQNFGKINGSVFAAGNSEITPLKGYAENIARNILEVSFWNAIEFIQLVMKNKYIQKESSHIVFSSVSGYSGEKGMFAYSGAKAAIRIAIKSIAKEIANKNHRINTISPGWVKNDMTQKASELADVGSFYAKHLLGAGEITDVSGAVLFLLSDRAKWITGTDFIVDGGYLA